MGDFAAPARHRSWLLPSREYYLVLVINGNGVWRAEESIEQHCPLVYEEDTR
jgi:hypothetical protein